MGYTTEFSGAFKFNKKLDDETYALLVGLNNTRRMARNVDQKYGVEGEFYISGKGYAGQDHEENIINHNMPPKTQPGLWLNWMPTEDRIFLKWDGGEKFYCYVEWLQYLIDKIFIPRGYSISGNVKYRGEDFDDVGTIVVKDNIVNVVIR